MIKALEIALGGLDKASQKVVDSANNIAKFNTQNTETIDEINLSEEAVKLMLAEIEYKANLETIDVVEDITEDLLDILDED